MRSEQVFAQKLFEKPHCGTNIAQLRRTEAAGQNWMRDLGR